MVQSAEVVAVVRHVTSTMAQCCRGQFDFANCECFNLSNSGVKQSGCCSKSLCAPPAAASATYLSTISALRQVGRHLFASALSLAYVC